MKIQKGLSAMNKLSFYLLVLLSFFVFSCSENVNTDDKLLAVYFSDYLKENKKSSIFLSGENTNSEIYDRYLRLIQKRVKLDPNLKDVISESENENFKKQVVDSSEWDLDLSNFDNVYSSDEAKNKQDVLYITKPIYAYDKKYALLYSYKKGVNDVYFIPPIKVYKNNNGIWEKVALITETGLNK